MTVPENLDFFKANVDFYSSGYKDFSLRPWESKIVSLVSGEVLDVACGGGRVTVPMLENGNNVTGTDFVKEFEAKVRQHEPKFKGKFKFVEAWMYAIPFPDNTFDTVTCINSIVYTKNIEGYTKSVVEMARVLKPGGKLYFTSWNMWHPLWGASILLNYLLRRAHHFGETSPFFTMDKRTSKGPVHMYVPDPGTIREICSTAGIIGDVYTSDKFMGNNGPLTAFHPILVVAGTKTK